MALPDVSHLPVEEVDGKVQLFGTAAAYPVIAQDRDPGPTLPSHDPMGEEAELDQP
jgi:hypothetical protein